MTAAEFASPAASVADLQTCRLVLPTSKGVVTNAAMAPLVAPATNESVKIALSSSVTKTSLSTRCRSIGPRWCFLPYLSCAKKALTLSYPHQYIPENGTSLQSVNIRPLHSDVTPSWATMLLTLIIVCLNAETLSPGAAEAPTFGCDAACNLVLNSSNGAITVAAIVLAILPATKGAMLSDSFDIGDLFEYLKDSYPVK
ncbi:hypothetical protein ABW20_dc0102811 [Dactylellina cionopaga]|nr:hypothetical protein ABW20_dc0102811 [Dactylellina cionopaga]